MKKIQSIGIKRALLACVFRARNDAVHALDADDQVEYERAMAELCDLVRSLGTV